MTTAAEKPPFILKTEQFAQDKNLGAYLGFLRGEPKPDLLHAEKEAAAKILLNFANQASTSAEDKIGVFEYAIYQARNYSIDNELQNLVSELLVIAQDTEISAETRQEAARLVLYSSGYIEQEPDVLSAAVDAMVAISEQEEKPDIIKNLSRHDESAASAGMLKFATNNSHAADTRIQALEYLLAKSNDFAEPTSDQMKEAANLLLAIAQDTGNPTADRLSATKLLLESAEPNSDQKATAKELLLVIAKAEVNSAAEKTKAAALLIENPEPNSDAINSLLAIAQAANNSTDDRLSAIKLLLGNVGPSSSTINLLLEIAQNANNPEVERMEAVNLLLEKVELTEDQTKGVAQALTIVITSRPENTKLFFKAIESLFSYTKPSDTKPSDTKPSEEQVQSVATTLSDILSSTSRDSEAKAKSAIYMLRYIPNLSDEAIQKASDALSEHISEVRDILESLQNNLLSEKAIEAITTLLVKLNKPLHRVSADFENIEKMTPKHIENLAKVIAAVIVKAPDSGNDILYHTFYHLFSATGSSKNPKELAKAQPLITKLTELSAQQQIAEKILASIESFDHQQNGKSSELRALVNSLLISIAGNSNLTAETRIGAAKLAFDKANTLKPEQFSALCNSVVEGVTNSEPSTAEKAIGFLLNTISGEKTRYRLVPDAVAALKKIAESNPTLVAIELRNLNYPNAEQSSRLVGLADFIDTLESLELTSLRVSNLVWRVIGTNVHFSHGDVSAAKKSAAAAIKDVLGAHLTQEIKYSSHDDVGSMIAPIAAAVEKAYEGRPNKFTLFMAALREKKGAAETKCTISDYRTDAEYMRKQLAEHSTSADLEGLLQSANAASPPAPAGANGAAKRVVKRVLDHAS